MTTIAFNYKDKEIAVDSRLTRGDMISTDSGNKIFKKDGVVFIVAGETNHSKSLVDMWFSGEVDVSLNCSAFVVCNGEVYDFGLDADKNIAKELVDENLTKGSGDLWAHAAMDFGCSAKDAVKYAMTRDVYTGGKVRVIKV
jgi:20S proteasome alpha/beta subunit